MDDAKTLVPLEGQPAPSAPVEVRRGIGIGIIKATRASSDRQLLDSWIKSMRSPHSRRACEVTGGRFIDLLAKAGVDLRTATVEDVQDALEVLVADVKANSGRQYIATGQTRGMRLTRGMTMSDKRQLTAKQERFALLYLEIGNASEAYRRSYDVGKMDDRTAQKRAHELLHHPGVAARVGDLQKAAANGAVLDRQWVLTRLMENAEVALGKKTIKARVPRKDKDSGKVEVSDIEVTAHDAAAANRALELLGRAAEVQLFSENAAVVGPAPVDNSAHEEHIERLVKRYSTPLKVIDGGARSPEPSKKAADGGRG